MSKRTNVRGAPGLEDADLARFPADLRAILVHALEQERAARPARARRAYLRVRRSVGADAALATCVERWIGRTFVDEGMLSVAETHFEEARTLAERTGSPRAVAMATNLLAIAAQLTGRLAEAELKYGAVARMARGSGEQQLLAMAQQNLGTIASIQGRHEEAAAHARRAVRLYQSLGLEGKAAVALNNLGMVYATLGDWERARRAYRRALRGSRLVGDTTASLRIRVNLAQAYVACGEIERAERSCDRILRRVGGEVQGAAAWAGDAWKIAGVVHRHRGRTEQARWCFEQAMRIAVERNDPLLEAEAAREAAELFIQEGRNREALELLNRAHARFLALEARRDVAGIAEKLEAFERRFLQLVQAWGASLEARDPYTQGHCERVAALATRLAARCGFPSRTLFWFRIGALLHDVGKLHIPLEVLNKPGPLTERERAVIEEHPVIGAEMLASVEFPWDVRPLIRNHHERWDGQGYPDRLAGEQIPLAARILTVADVYDALTTTRSYRQPFAVEDALAIMQQGRGRLFDPVLLDRFLEMVREQPAAEEAGVVPHRRAG